MSDEWMDIWLLFWLFSWAAADIQRREIRGGPAATVLAAGVLWQLLKGRLLTWSIAGAALIGGVFWAFSCLSGERMGRGDALVILCVCLYLGFGDGLAVLMLAFLLSSGSALYLLLVRKKPARYSIPFIPFLAAAAGAVMALRVGEGGL